jgi:hypothetical protein
VTPEGGIVAYLALLLIVPATIWAFAALSPHRAVLAVLLGSVLFLPELANFDAPLIPPMDKRSIPALCMLVAVLFTARNELRTSRVGRGIDLLMGLLLIGIVGTTLGNRDQLVYGKATLQGYALHDTLSESVRAILGTLAPFLLGRTLFRNSQNAEDLLRGLVVAGLIYSPFVLLEVRLSPQLHGWVYGYGQHSFAQTVRSGGWRPMVFMAHGLALALFVCACSLAAWTMSRARLAIFGWPAKYFAVWLSVLLVLVNSLGALVYGLVATPLIWLIKPRTQLVIAASLAVATALYPVARATEVFPTQALVDFSATIDHERAASLKFRFDNEDLLLEKALERPWFGWGGNARYRVINEQGIDVSVTDGAWIILLGAYGIVGFSARFALLLLPIIMALRQVGRMNSERQVILAGIALMATIYTVDLLPNGLFNELPLFLSGVVAGLAQGMPQEAAHGRLDPAVLLRWLARLRSVSSERFTGANGPR